MLIYVVILLKLSLLTSGHQETPVEIISSFNKNEKLSHMLDSGLFNSTMLIVKEQLLPSLNSLSNSSDDSEVCTKKLMALFSSLETHNRTESIKFLDALGKPPSGILNGNTVLMGSYDSCKAFQSSTKGYYRPCKISAAMTLEEKISFPVTWTVCFPKECRDGNYTALKETVLRFMNSDPKLLYVSENSVTTTCDASLEYGAGAYVAITVLSIIVFLVLVGTLWEPVAILLCSINTADDRKVLVNAECLEHDPGVGDGILPTVDNVEPKNTSVLGEVMKCFSLQRTLEALLSTNTKEGQILCLNGIRVLSINWVVLGHLYYIGTSAADFTDYASMWRRLLMSVVYNALSAVDTFFFLSGFLVSFLLSKDLLRKGRFDAVGYYLHRYLRLTAPFFVVTLGQGFLAHLYLNGPFEDLLKVGTENCRKWWWTNLLYINNLVPWNTVEICIGQSWYLSNDFQFFIIAPLFIYLLYKHPKVGVAVSSLALLGSCVTAASLTAYYKLGPTVVFDSNTTVDFADFRLLYVKPWVRVSPYLVGILGGWLCFYQLDSLKLYLSRMSLVSRLLTGSLVWLCTCTVQYWVVFGLHNDMEKKTRAEPTNELENILYEGLARSSWSVALLVQIVACQTGLGGFINKLLSWRGWIVLSRLTFSVYLLHFIIIQAYVVQLRHPFFFRPDYEIAILYIGLLGMSYASATLLYTFVEQPVAFLERLTYRRQ